MSLSTLSKGNSFFYCVLFIMSNSKSGAKGNKVFQRAYPLSTHGRIPAPGAVENGGA